MELKQRIFSGREEFSLEEVLESLARETEGVKALIFTPEKEQKQTIEELEQQLFIIDKPGTPNIVLYEIEKDLYYVYKKQQDKEEIWTNYISDEGKEESSYGLFVPSGVMVSRVPQNILGNGVLGRAFIHSNYIEILDSLMGPEYTEVLTHEVLHILHPEKQEMQIRQLTRNYLGNSTTYH